MDRKQQQIEYQKRYRSNPENKHLMKIRKVASEACADGELKKMPCSICGNEKSEMHHPNYSKPFEVEWLCRKHHMEKHPRFGKSISDLVIRKNISLYPEVLRRLKWLKKYYQEHTDSGLLSRLVNRDYQSIQEARKMK